MRKAILLLFVLIFSLSLAQAQEKTYEPHPKYPHLFNDLEPVEENAPEWVHKMYSANPNLFEIEKAYTAYYKVNEFVKTFHTQNYKTFMKKIHQNHWYKDDGTIDVIKENPTAAKELQKVAQSKQAANWTPIGPLETFGNGGTQTRSEQVNVLTIAQSVTNPSIMLCGTQTGAVFKSIDKGENWFSVGDDVFDNGDIVSVEIDPTNPNIMFVSTMDYIYKSTNGGVNWTDVFYGWDLYVREFAINPNNNQIIFAAASKGLYKSINGGSNWTQVYTDACYDIKFKVNDPQTVFLLKKNDTLKLTEFLKSTDGGVTFSPRNNGWFVPTLTSTIGGARMGVTNADPERIYVVMLGNVDNQATDKNYIGVYRSDNAGESWSLPYDQNNDGTPNNNPGGPYSADHWSFSTSGVNGGSFEQGFYNLAIDVSDTDPNKFLMGMLNLFKSENGGKTYSRWGGYDDSDTTTSYYRHPDHQDILITGNDVFVATDGGIDLYDANLNIVRAINKGINGSENWGFGQGWNEDVLACGRYHNGNGIYHPNYGNGKFISLGGGEAPTGYVSLGDNFKVYHSDIDAKKMSSNFTTLSTTIPNFLLFPNEAYYTDAKSEIEYDPRYFNHMYLGKENKLWKSTDEGLSFTLLKEFGTTTDYKVTGIEISRKNPDIIFVVQREGSVYRLWRTQDGGANWTPLTLPANSTFISLNENNVLFIASGSNVYKSTDLGDTWTSLTTPTISGQNISGIIVQMGTNDGVYITMSSNKLYYRNASHADWQLFNQGLPVNNHFMGVLPFYKNGELRISGTRGFWKTPLFEPSLPIAQPMVASKTVDCHRAEIQFDDYSVLNHTGATWAWSFPGATTVSSTSIRNPLVTYTTPGLYDVSLTVTDSNGKSSYKAIDNIIEVLQSTCAIETQALNVLEMNTTSQSIASNTLSYGSTPNLTFTGWVKPNGIQSKWAGIICLGSTPKNVLGFRDNNQLQIHLNNTLYDLNTGLTADANQWNFVAYRIEPNRITIFLNDKQFTYPVTSTAINLNKIILGKDYNTSDRTYNGQMEEFKVWNRALTDDEIYLNRHLIPETTTDPNLIAYYQFNNPQNSGFVYDKKNANDLSISSSITFPASTAPIGVGTSQLMTINAAGTYNFNDSFANLDFTAAGPNGKVVVSKINVAPNEIPSTNSIANEYWILDNYGANTTFTGFNTASLQTSANLSSLSPSNLSIYKRVSNGHIQSDWAQDATATSINSNTIQFPGSGLNQSYQWFIGSNVSLGVDPIVVNTKFTVYPNPYIQGQTLKVNGLDSNYIFSLYDMSGKFLFKIKPQSSEIKIDKILTSGLYFYRIETENKIFNGKLIID